MSITRPITRPITGSITSYFGVSSSSGGVIPSDPLFDIADYPAGLVLDFSDQSKVIRTGRTVTSVLDSSGNNRTMGVIGSPQYYQEDNGIHIAPGQALFRADDGFLKSGVASVFAIFTLKTSNGLVQPIFAKYNSTGNQCSLMIALDSTAKPRFHVSNNGTAVVGNQLNDTIPTNDPTCLSFTYNVSAQETQSSVDANIEKQTTGSVLSPIFDSTAGYGINYINGAAGSADIYLHYLMVYDDETVDISAKRKLEGYLFNWYDDKMSIRSPVNITSPTITGTSNVGYVLTINNGLALREPKYSYQWTRAGVDILNATQKNYLLVPADQGFAIGCRIMIWNIDGAVANANPSLDSVVLAGSVCGAAFGSPPSPTAPSVTSSAVISGNPINRQELFCTPSTVISGHEFTRSYQWFVNDTPIFGAYSQNYTVQQLQEGEQIECVESITNPYGTTTSASNILKAWTPLDKTLDVWYNAHNLLTYRETARVGVEFQHVEVINSNVSIVNSAVQSVQARQPIISHIEMNGYPAFVFDGINHFLQTQIANDFVNKTVFFVAKGGREILGYNNDPFTGLSNPDDPIYGNPVSGTLFSHATENNSIRFDSNGQVQFTSSANNWGGPVVYSLPTEPDEFGVTSPGLSQPHVYSFVFDVNLKLYVDGDLKTTSGARTGTAAKLFNQIGARAGTIERFNGAISELIVVSSIMNDADRQLFEGYLSHKYGLKNKLPAGHLYKNSAPLVATWSVLTDLPPQLYFDMSHAPSITSSGGLLDSLSNRGSIVANWTSAGVNRPTYDVVGKRAVFGPSMYLGGPDLAGFNNSGSLSVFIVFERRNASGALERMFNQWRSATNQRSFYIGFNSTGNPIVVTSTAGTVDSTTLTISNAAVDLYDVNLLTWIHDSVGNTQTLRLNGNTVYSASGTAPPLFNQSEAIGINLVDAGFAGNFQGSFFTLIGYNRALTNAERDNVEGYIWTKWDALLANYVEAP